MRLKIALWGSNGKMGKAVAAVAESISVDIAYARGRKSSGDIPPEAYDLIVDFSSPEGAIIAAKKALQEKKPLIIGSTGHNLEQMNFFYEASKSIPILKASNFSIGINTLMYLVKKSTQILPQNWHVEIVEKHHAKKKDAPSGTAIDLARCVTAAREWNEDALVFGRHGEGLREEAQVGVHAIRAGNVIGEHTVLFGGEGELIEITHKASDRHIYAQGALRGAQWLMNKPAGLYSMLDVLGLKD